MSQETKDPNQEKATTPASRNAKNNIDLFPVSPERKQFREPAPAGGGIARIGTQISIFNPATFDEAVDIVECLRGRAATTITLDKMKKTEANRLVDFVSGASAALDGDFYKLTESVYVFSPANIKIVAPTQPTSTKSGAGALDFLFSSDLMSDKTNAPRRQ